MKYYNILAAAFVASIVAFVTVAASSHQQRHFEVKVIYPISGPQGTDELLQKAIKQHEAEVADAGRQGWELVTVTQGQAVGETTYYFKRALAE